jgi:MoxR-like ATPase
VLIDEIDKAPRDFPNDLLAELEKPPFKFTVKELPDFEIQQAKEIPIFVIITSNNEKGLPDAFLRRCVFHHINFPEAGDLLKIVQANLKRQNEYFIVAIQRFLEFRKQNIAKKPATSELIDWIACLEERKLLNNNLADLTKAGNDYKQKIVDTLGIIAKSRNDFEILSKEIAGN